MAVPPVAQEYFTLAAVICVHVCVCCFLCVPDYISVCTVCTTVFRLFTSAPCYSYMLHITPERERERAVAIWVFAYTCFWYVNMQVFFLVDLYSVSMCNMFMLFK